MPMLHLAAYCCGKTRPKVIRRYARRRVPAIQCVSEGNQEISLEVGRWVWRPEGSYPVMLEEVVELRPLIVGTARVQTGLYKVPDLGEQPLIAGWKGFREP